MATKKTVTEIKKPVSQSKSVVKYDEEFAKRAKATVAQEKDAIGGGNFIGTRGGILSYKQNPIPGNKIDCIILEAIKENNFYVGKFNPDEPMPPVCFAFGKGEEEMRPHPDSTEPQSETCDTCQHNEYGTADTGKGKACQNRRRIALIEASALDSATGIAEADIAYLKTNVLSVKNYTNYVTNLAKTAELPPCAFVTNITTKPDPKSQFRILFQQVNQIDEKHYGAIFQKVEQAEKEIDFPYVALSEEDIKEREAQSKKRSANNKFARKQAPPEKAITKDALKRGARR